MPKELIRWTDAERAKVVEETTRLRCQDLEASLLVIVERAQQILPAARRRNLISKAVVGEWFFEAVTRRFQEVLATPHTVEVPVETVIEVPQSLKAVPTPELLLELLTRFACKLDVLDRLLSDAPHAQPITTLGQTMTRQTLKKPMIVIAGLIQNQPKYVENKLGHALAFTFIESDSAKHSAFPQSAAKVYVITKFANHAMEQRLRSHYNGLVSRHTGGLSTLVETIAKDLHIVL